MFTHPRSRPPFRAARALLLALTALFAMLTLLGVGAGAFAAKYTYEQYLTLQDLPVEGLTWAVSSVVYDRAGRPVHTLTGPQNVHREYVSLGAIPAHVQDAVIAIEDARFRSHHGVDLVRIAGAAIHDLRVLWTGEGRLQGASTLTQQLAKNAFLSQEQTLQRKVREALLAIELERRLSKDEILAAYLNGIYFGHNFYGIGAAARGYFAKPAADLTLAEGALLAGIIQAPAHYDPYTNPEAALARRRVVLDAMAAQGMIAPAVAAAAAAEPLHLGDGAPQPAASFVGDWYVDHIIDALTTPALAERYGLPLLSEEDLWTGGYRIYAALDLELQQQAAETVATVMDPEQGPHDDADDRDALYMPADQPDAWVQVAMVAMDPESGRVRAIIGGRRHERMRQLNRATDTLRQPGSTFKPLAVYIPAIEELGYGTGTVVDDVPLRPETRGGRVVMWPENYEQFYRGLTPLREGVEQSVNAMAVQVMAKLGPDRALAYPERMGITSLVRTGPRNDVQLALALGGLTRGVSVLEMATAYATIANLGIRTDPVLIERIVDREGRVMYAADPQREQVISPATAWLVTDMMKGVIRRGTAQYHTAGFNGWPAAGKTGTTEEFTDAWFIGYTRNLVTAVWTGYDNRDQARSLPWTGAFKPVQLWNHFMTGAITEPPPDWPRPDDIVARTVCAKTGLLPSRLCPEKDRRVEYFRRGTEPATTDERFWTEEWAVAVTMTGSKGERWQEWRLWRPGCPGRPERRVFLRRPPYPQHPDLAQRWLPRWVPRDAALAPPTQYCELPPLLKQIEEWLGRPGRGDPDDRGKPDGHGKPDGRGDP